MNTECILPPYTNSNDGKNSRFEYHFANSGSLHGLAYHHKEHKRDFAAGIQWRPPGTRLPVWKNPLDAFRGRWPDLEWAPSHQ